MGALAAYVEEKKQRAHSEQEASKQGAWDKNSLAMDNVRKTFGVEVKAGGSGGGKFMEAARESTGVHKCTNCERRGIRCEWPALGSRAQACKACHETKASDRKSVV